MTNQTLLQLNTILESIQDPQEQHSPDHDMSSKAIMEHIMRILYLDTVDWNAKLQLIPLKVHIEFYQPLIKLSRF